MPSEQQAISKRTVRLRLRDLKLLELNARYMKHETFQSLIRNIRRDGGLMGATPFACRVGEGETLLEDGTVLPHSYLVLSGNHRTMAAIEAGIEFEDVTITDDDLPEQRRVAIQLSQNAITGEDDPTILKQLYESMDDVSWRDYAGLDDKSLELLESVQVGSLSEANLSFQTVNIAFLPDEIDRVKEAWDAAREHVGSGPDEVWVARMVEHERLLDALDLTGKSYGVKNIAVALEVILRVFHEHREDLASGFLTEHGDPRPGQENKWVPLEAVLGSEVIPASAAATVRRAIKAMRRAGEIPDGAGLWQALEFWAADYLAGPDV